MSLWSLENAQNIYKKKNATDFWIGASDLASSGVWTWTDGTPFGYNAWASGEPNGNAGSDCVSSKVADGTWVASNCFSTKPYICNVPPLPQHTCPARCDSEWAYFSESSSCYRTFYNAKWNDAEASCVSEGGHLASIHSSAENSFVAGKFQINEFFEFINVGKAQKLLTFCIKTTASNILKFYSSYQWGKKTSEYLHLIYDVLSFLCKSSFNFCLGRYLLTCIFNSHNNKIRV